MPGLILAMFAIGAGLGMRYKVLILVPAFGLVFAATLAVASAGGSNISTCVIAAALAFGSLQIGYLSGAAMRFYITPRSPPKTAWSPTRGNALPT
jgi:hypothetical protein